MRLTETQKVLMADVTRALEDINIDPNKIAKVPLFPAMLKEYISGKWSRRQFQDNCRKICIFNGDKLDKGFCA